jgi:small subunit ribosomal protein S3
MIEKHFVDVAYKNLRLEKFFQKRLKRAGFNSMEVVKTPIATKIIIRVAKPGLAVGHGGKNIAFLKSKLETEFGFKNPHIDVKNVENMDYDVKHKVDMMINSLERGMNWRTVAYRVVKDLSRLKLMGFELIIKGKLMAKGGRKQKYRFPFGYIKKVGGMVSLVSEHKDVAHTRAGAIGITLRLIPPDVVFPDKLTKEEILEAINKYLGKVKKELEGDEETKEGEELKEEVEIGQELEGEVKVDEVEKKIEIIKEEPKEVPKVEAKAESKVEVKEEKKPMEKEVVEKVEVSEIKKEDSPKIEKVIKEVKKKIEKTKEVKKEPKEVKAKAEKVTKKIKKE